MPDASDMSHPVTRVELREELGRFATKADLREELDRKLADYPTRAEHRFDLEGWAQRIIEFLRSELRAEMRAGFQAMREELAMDVARHIRAANEEMRDWLRGFDDRYKDLPPRVDQLEAKVFAPKRRRRR